MTTLHPRTRLPRVAVLIALLGACSPTPAPAPSANAERYMLVWSDEFTGDGPLDSTHWAYENGFVRNQELQWYQPENATRVNGMLVIEGRRERKPNPRYVAPSASGGATATPNAT